MHDKIPRLVILLLTRRIKAYPVAPKVPHLTDFIPRLLVTRQLVRQSCFGLLLAFHQRVIGKLGDGRSRSDLVRIDDELEEKLVEVGFNIDALPLIREVVADKHEVRVDFKPAVFAYD